MACFQAELEPGTFGIRSRSANHVAETFGGVFVCGVVIFMTEFHFLQIATSVQLTGLIQSSEAEFCLRALMFTCK
jgi:hypothetical protein